MPQQATAAIVINLPRAEAWEKLRDISLAHNYVPGIVNTEIITDQREGVGASRYVYRNAKSYLQETVTQWREGEGFRIKLHKGDKPALPFREAFFNYQLDEAGPNQTRFTATLGYQMPWGGFGEWLGKRMLGFVQSTVEDVATAMKLYYETGDPTSPAALKAYKKSAT